MEKNVQEVVFAFAILLVCLSCWKYHILGLSQVFWRHRGQLRSILRWVEWFFLDTNGKVKSSSVKMFLHSSFHRNRFGHASFFSEFSYTWYRSLSEPSSTFYSRSLSDEDWLVRIRMNIYLINVHSFAVLASLWGCKALLGVFGLRGFGSEFISCRPILK